MSETRKRKPSELIVGTITLLLLIAGAWAVYSHWMDAAQIETSVQAADKSALLRIESAILKYRLDTGVYPQGENLQIASQLLTASDGPYLKPDEIQVNEKGELLDAWGRPYGMLCTKAGKIVIHSSGANGKRGDGDDLVVSHTAGPQGR